LEYKIFIEKNAQKALTKITEKEQNRIIEAIRNLSQNPKPMGVKKLSGREAWRIRVGSYRIIYEIQDDKLLIVVISIGHRREIYRQ